jgi:hypothetical protein
MTASDIAGMEKIAAGIAFFPSPLFPFLFFAFVHLLTIARFMRYGKEFSLPDQFTNLLPEIFIDCELWYVYFVISIFSFFFLSSFLNIIGLVEVNLLIRMLSVAMRHKTIIMTL